MKHARLDLARRAELLPTLDGVIGVFGQIEIERLSGLQIGNLRCVSHSYVATEKLLNSGFRVGRDLAEAPGHGVVFVPRSKTQAWHLIAQARRIAPEGWIIVDGQKTDGIESIAKQVSRNVANVGSFSKGHGKTIWFKAKDADFLDAFLAQITENKGGYQTAPGVFSADDIDPASKMLLQNVPGDVSGQLGDFGAGWGYLSARLLSENRSISKLHLIEDNEIALECARLNVTDQRAEFHWVDALKWKPSKLLDCVVMNPPFHAGRSANPELGKDFIRAAARALRPGGKLYLVANAHLPYEEVLEKCFTHCELLERSSRFKVFCATRGRDKLA